MENYDTPRVQQKGREIQVESKDGCDAVQPCKGTGKACLTKEIKEGQVFGKITVVRKAYIDSGEFQRWLVKCECGKEFTTRIYGLFNGQTKSCGCLRKQRFQAFITSHELSGTPEYHAWNNMKMRCLNPSNKNYFRYGARGITVCSDWVDSFERFFADMGARPSSKHSIDRIDNNAGYCKSNCRWATAKEQMRNTRRTVLTTINGESLTFQQWSEKTGISHDTLRYRINSGWDKQKAITLAPIYDHSGRKSVPKP